jgi:hypothetical protein
MGARRTSASARKTVKFKSPGYLSRQGGPPGLRSFVRDGHTTFARRGPTDMSIT